jgi:hypothetical protein
MENNDLNPIEAYKNILKQYSNNRNKVQIYIYYDNEIDLMRNELKLTTHELSAIMFAISLTGFCTEKNFRNNNSIFAKINTKYIEEDIYIVLKGEVLIDSEYLILIDLVNYFELKVDIEILEAENLHFLNGN